MRSSRDSQCRIRGAQRDTRRSSHFVHRPARDTSYSNAPQPERAREAVSAFRSRVNRRQRSDDYERSPFETAPRIETASETLMCPKRREQRTRGPTLQPLLFSVRAKSGPAVPARLACRNRASGLQPASPAGVARQSTLLMCKSGTRWPPFFGEDCAAPGHHRHALCAECHTGGTCLSRPCQRSRNQVLHEFCNTVHVIIVGCDTTAQAA